MVRQTTNRRHRSVSKSQSSNQGESLSFSSARLAGTSLWHHGKSLRFSYYRCKSPAPLRFHRSHDPQGFRQALAPVTIHIIVRVYRIKLWTNQKIGLAGRRTTIERGWIVTAVWIFWGCMFSGVTTINSLIP